MTTEEKIDFFIMMIRAILRKNGEIPDETTNKQNKENKKRRNHQAE